MHTFHVDVQAIAAQNEGLIRTRDLVELGLSDAAIRSVTRRLRRICWGAYVLSAPASEESDIAWWRERPSSAIARPWR